MYNKKSYETYLARAVGTIGEIVKSNYFGVTVDPDSEQSLAEGIIDFLNNKEKIKKKIENSAKSYLRQANWNNVASEIEESYEKSIS